jgi:hypothetical protein
MQITKFKSTNDVFSIEFEEVVGASTVAFQVSSKDAPSEGFSDSLRNMKTIVKDVCELNDELANIEIKGVSFSAQKDANVGIIFTATRKLFGSDSPMNFNSPLKMLHPVGEGENKKSLQDNYKVFVETFIEQCTEYIKGMRLQTSLHLE